MHYIQDVCYELQCAIRMEFDTSHINNNMMHAATVRENLLKGQFIQL